MIQVQTRLKVTDNSGVQEIMCIRILEKGTSNDFGARPLRRAIEQYVEDPLSEDILRGNFKGKDLIRISVKAEEDDNKHLYFDAQTTPAPSPEKQLAQATSDAT